MPGANTGEGIRVDDDRQKVAEFIELKSAADKVPQICARAAVHFERGESVAIYADDPAEAEEIDDQLWTFRQNSFVPHVRREKAAGPVVESVVIFAGEPGEMTADVLILASSGALPAWVGRFPHVYDFAHVYDADLRGTARKRFAACKAAGYRMRFIKPEPAG